MTAANIDSKANARPRTTGQFLTFVLGQVSYGIPVLCIREIIRITDIAATPGRTEPVDGVINLRGKPIHVVDLRIKFGLAKAGTTERSCIIVVQVALDSGIRALMGLIVDSVEEVINITPGDAEATPDFGGKAETQYMVGMAKVRGTVMTLLDIDQIVAAEAVVELAKP